LEQNKKDISTKYFAFLDKFESKSEKKCRLNIWHLNEEKIVKQWMISEFPKRLHFLTNQNQLVMYYKNHIEMWNIQSEQIENIFKMNEEIVYGIELKENRLVILMNSGNKPTYDGWDELQIWDLTTSTCKVKRKSKVSVASYPRIKVMDQYFIVPKEQRNRNRSLSIYEGQNGKMLKIWEFKEEISDFVANGDEELIIGFENGIIEFWKGA